MTKSNICLNEIILVKNFEGTKNKFILNSTHCEHTGGTRGFNFLGSQKDRVGWLISHREDSKGRNQDLIIIGDIDIDYAKYQDQQYNII